MPYYFLWGIGVDMVDDDGGHHADESFGPTDDTDDTDLCWLLLLCNSSDDTDLSRLATPMRGMDSFFVDVFFAHGLNGE